LTFLSQSIFGSGYYPFRARYAVLQEMTVANKTFKVVVGYRRMEELKGIVAKYSTRVEINDCTDLPAKVYMRRDVELGQEQAALYQQMKQFAVAELEGKILTAPLAITQMMRLRQILCGFFKDEEGGVHPIEDSKRVALIMEALEEINGKVIILSPFRCPAFAISAAIEKEYGKDRVSTYVGGTKDRDAVKERFNDPSSGVDYLVCTGATVKYGVNIKAAYMLWVAPDPDLDIRLQGEARCYGINRGIEGQSTVYIDFVAPGTIEEKIYTALRNKKKIADLITGDKWREFLG